MVGLIQGTIVDEKQTPVPYANLVATNVDSVNPESQRMTSGTDQKGFYQFVDVPEGRYSIIVTKKGFEEYKVPLVTVRPGETVKLPAIKMLSAAGDGQQRPIAQIVRPGKHPSKPSSA